MEVLQYFVIVHISYYTLLFNIATAQGFTSDPVQSPDYIVFLRCSLISLHYTIYYPLSPIPKPVPNVLLQVELLIFIIFDLTYTL